MRTGRGEEGSFIFRYIELELFGLFACHFIHEYLHCSATKR